MPCWTRAASANSSVAPGSKARAPIRVARQGPCRGGTISGSGCARHCDANGLSDQLIAGASDIVPAAMMLAVAASLVGYHTSLAILLIAGTSRAQGDLTMSASPSANAAGQIKNPRSKLRGIGGARSEQA